MKKNPVTASQLAVAKITRTKIDQLVKKLIDAESDDGVYSTTDIDKLLSFLVEGTANRYTTTTHVRKLAEDMKERGFRSIIELGLTTIFNEKGEWELKILDGQNRTKAAHLCSTTMGRNVKVRFVVEIITTKQQWARDHIQAQLLVKKQSTKDFVAPQSFAGKKAYAELYSAYQYQKGLRAGKPITLETIMHAMYGTYGYRQAWQNGTFEIMRPRAYKKTLQLVYKLQDALGVYGAMQSRCLVEITMHKKYNHLKMIQGIEKRKNKEGVVNVNLRNKASFLKDLHEIGKLPFLINEAKISKAA